MCVLVHGGFWKAEYGADLMDDLALDLVARGWAAWNVEYRRLRPGPDAARGGEWPALFEDVAAAVDLLAELAVEHALDLDRVAVAGHSAGGHLSAWIAGRAGLPDGAVGAAPRVRVAAAVLQAGVLDLAAKAAEDAEGAGRVADLIGLPAGSVVEVDAPQGAESSTTPRDRGQDRDRDRDRPAAAAAAGRLRVTSPMAMLPVGVPILAVHGERDGVVVPAYSRRYVEAALAAGDEAELAAFADEEHMGHTLALNPMWRAAASWLDARVPATGTGSGST